MSKKVSGWPLIAPRKLPEGLPAYTAEDAGKALSLGENGPEWKPKNHIVIDATSENATLITPYADVVEFQKSGLADITIKYGETSTDWELLYDAVLRPYSDTEIVGKGTLWSMSASTIELSLVQVKMSSESVTIAYASASINAEIS